MAAMAIAWRRVMSFTGSLPRGRGIDDGAFTLSFLVFGLDFFAAVLVARMPEAPLLPPKASKRPAA
jgi:hypothetical protein